MANPSPLEFFEAFFPNPLVAGKLALYTTTLRRGNKSSSWCFNLSQADRLCLSYRQTRRMRFGVGLQNSRRALTIARERRCNARPGSVRGCDASVVAVPALWVEIPFGTGALPLPPGLRQALDLLDAVEQRPSIVVSSRTATGGKVHAFWLLEDLWVFDPPDLVSAGKAVAIALLGRLRWAVARLAAESGWQIPTTVDLASACPVPGLPTGASAKGPRAVLEAFPLIAGDSRYHRRDFESLPEPPAADPQPWGGLFERAASLAELPRRARDLRPIVTGCSWIRHCHAERLTLPKVELDNAIELLLQCSVPGADSARLVHEICGGHPGYDPIEVDQQLAALLLTQQEPITCRRIGEQPAVASRHCSMCPHSGLIASPLDLAPEEDSAASGEGSTAAAPSTLPAAEDAAPSAGIATGGTSASGTSASGTSARPRILITSRQHEVNDQARAALAASAELFEQDGALVERVGDQWLRVTAPRIQELLSRHVDFVVEVGAAGSGQLRPVPPPRWVVGALRTRGQWPGLRQAPGPSPQDRAPGPDHNSDAADLLAGIEQVLDIQGGAATARQIVLALAAEPERFPALGAAFERFWPKVEPGDPAAATVLGYQLRGIKHRPHGGRALIEARRARDGIVWAVHRPPSLSANDRKEEACQ